MIELSLIGAGYYVTNFIKKEKMKAAKHLLISSNFDEIIIGIDNLGKQETKNILPNSVKPMLGLTYKQFSVYNILFIGYTETFREVKSGIRLESAQKKMNDMISAEVSLAGEVLSQLANKTKPILTLVFFDKASNKYIETELDLNNNKLNDYEDYLMSLVNKQKMKFFTDPKQNK